MPSAVSTLCIVFILVATVPGQGQTPAPASRDQGTNSTASSSTAGDQSLVLSLTQAMEMAVRNNAALRSSLLDEKIQREQIREALGVFDPTFFAEATAGRSEVLFASNFPLDPGDPLSPTVVRVISQTADVANLQFGVRGILETGMSYDLTFQTDYRNLKDNAGLNPIFTNSTSLNFSQPLLRSAWSSYQLAAVSQARISSLEARENYRISERDKLKEVQQAYFDLVFALADEGVKRKSVKLAEEQVEITDIRVKSGALAEIESTSARSALALRRSELVTAEAQSIEAEDRLRRLILAFDEAEDWDLRLRPAEVPRDDFVEVKDRNEIARIAERTHPEVLRAHLALARARLELSRKESENDPRLDLKGNVNFAGLDDSNFDAYRLSYSREGAASWNLGLSFEYPLGNRAAGARVASSMLALRKAALTLQDARTEMIFGVRNALRNVDVARRSIAARREAERLAQEQLENERLRLELKRSTNFQVFQVEEDLNLRRTELIRAQLDYRLAILELVRVTGAPLSALLK